MQKLFIPRCDDVSYSVSTFTKPTQVTVAILVRLTNYFPYHVNNIVTFFLTSLANGNDIMIINITSQK